MVTKTCQGSRERPRPEDYIGRVAAKSLHNSFTPCSELFTHQSLLLIKIAKMAHQRLPSGDWRRIKSPDGNVLYFNSTTNQTSWEPPTSPPIFAPNASTPMQNSSPPPPYQDTYGQDSSQTMPNYYSYPPNPPPTNPHYEPSPPSPGYRSPPAPPAGSPYSSQHQSYGQDNSQLATTLLSLLGSAVRAAISPGQFNPSPYGNSGYPQAPVLNATYPTAGTMPSPAPSSAGQVIVNKQPLDQQSLLRLQMMGVRIVPGRYW